MAGLLSVFVLWVVALWADLPWWWLLAPAILGGAIQSALTPGLRVLHAIGLWGVSLWIGLPWWFAGLVVLLTLWGWAIHRHDRVANISAHVILWPGYILAVYLLPITVTVAAGIFVILIGQMLR